MSDTDGGYRVLARKYRPQRFEDLIGQETMVQILTGAIKTGRIAHAFILTGVRGVGKTTTARLLARALNYQREGIDGPTLDISIEGEHCRAIAESRHLDVLEMDAASRTGIGDIREIIDSVKFKPVLARYKVYIIDEVHMLSTAAFNGLLKTLEEPPPHAKFIFATTEIRKVPVTVLSRCQRFDLKRVDQDRLAEHLTRICAAEDVAVEPRGLKLIAKAAEGSVRDSLSLLDQAITLAAPGETVSAARIEGMLGLSDRTRIIDLFEALVAGKMAEALAISDDLAMAGADPVVVLGDLLELTHWVTRLKVAASASRDSAASEEWITRGSAAADTLALSELNRIWQLLLKGVAEVRTAPNPQRAAEMVLIRIGHGAGLPSPEDLMKKLMADGPARSAPASEVPRPNGSNRPRAEYPGAGSGSGSGSGAAAAPQGLTLVVGDLAEAPAAAHASVAQPQPAVRLATLADIVAEADARRDIRFKIDLERHVHLVRMSEGSLEIRLAPNATPDLPRLISERLQAWTGRTWLVTLVREGGGPTLREEAEAREAAIRREVEAHPLVRAALELFPGARIGAIGAIVPSEIGGEDIDTVAAGAAAYPSDEDDEP